MHIPANALLICRAQLAAAQQSGTEEVQQARQQAAAAEEQARQAAQRADSAEERAKSAVQLAAELKNRAHKAEQECDAADVRSSELIGEREAWLLELQVSKCSQHHC